MTKNFTNPWDVGGEEYEQNALHDNVLSGSGDKKPKQIDLQGNTDEIYYGLIEWYDYIFQAPFLRKPPKDDRALELWNLNDICYNPPEYLNKGSHGTNVNQFHFTSDNIKFSYAISPFDFNKLNQFKNSYFFKMESNEDLSTDSVKIHFLGRLGGSINQRISFTIYDKNVYIPVLKKIYKGRGRY